jgi:hypothetical protein
MLNVRQNPSREVSAMPHYPTYKERSKRAFRAYIDVLETAEWLKGELRGLLLLFEEIVSGPPFIRNRSSDPLRTTKWQRFLAGPH